MENKILKDILSSLSFPNGNVEPTVGAEIFITKQLDKRDTSYGNVSDFFFSISPIADCGRQARVLIKPIFNLI